jgi:metallophosphoesterase superfamily enzyme
MCVYNIFRYIYKTFQKALSHVDPHVVVFLGDVMDEGSVATDEEFKRYVERFHNVFHVNDRVKVSAVSE